MFSFSAIWSAEKPFCSQGSSWTHLQLKEQNPVAEVEWELAAFTAHGGLQGTWGREHTAISPVPGQPGDMGAPERLEERQLQAGPSAEVNFTNWSNNNNGIGVTSLITAGLGFSRLYVVLISLMFGWWDACTGTRVGGRINTAEQIWSLILLLHKQMGLSLVQMRTVAVLPPTSKKVQLYLMAMYHRSIYGNFADAYCYRQSANTFNAVSNWWNSAAKRKRNGTESLGERRWEKVKHLAEKIWQFK